MVVVLSIGTAALSAATSDGSSSTAADFLHQAVEATLKSKSFTLQGYLGEGSDCSVAGSGLIMHAVYQAPDRFEEVDEDAGTYVAVGSSVFVLNDGSTSWLAEQRAGETATKDVSTWLSPLLGKGSVERSGSVYRSDINPIVLSKSFNLGADNTFGGAIKTIVGNGEVISEDIDGTLTDHSAPGLVVPLPVCGVFTYSEFGTSPTVSLPPAQDVVQCPPGKLVEVDRNSFVRCPSS